MSNKIAVIGLGNTLRRDDGIGIVILESLFNSYMREGIEYLNFGIASFDLVHRMERYEKILLIDAIDTSGLMPGELRIFELKDISYNLKSPPTSTHEFDLKSLFELYKKFELKSKIYVAGIQVKDTSYGEGISVELKNKLPAIIEKINDFINSI